MRTPDQVRSWPELLVLVAATSWDGVWQSERHLAPRLAHHVPILWVDPPISVLSPYKNPLERDTLRQHRLRMVAPRIARFTPVTVPGHTRPGLRRLASWHTRRLVRRCVSDLGVPVRATLVAALLDLLDVVDTDTRVLYLTDDWAAGAELMGLDPRWVADAEERQVRKATAVVTVSTVLRDKWSSVRPDVAVVPNGCDTNAFQQREGSAPVDVRLPRPIAGFVGHLSDRIDVSYLEAVAEAGISLLLVGPRQPTFEMARLERLLARPNVQWVGPKPFTELPAYLELMDVGLTPYADSAFNRASFPLKTLEYLAAGLPVVSTDLPMNAWLGTELVEVAADPDDLVKKVALVAASAGDPDAVARRRGFAARHTWDVRAAEIARIMGVTSG